MGLNGAQNYMQICCYEYFQDMQGLDVTLKAKLFLCVTLNTWELDVMLKTKFFFFILLRHMGTGCNPEGNVVS